MGFGQGWGRADRIAAELAATVQREYMLGSAMPKLTPLHLDDGSLDF